MSGLTPDRDFYWNPGTFKLPESILSGSSAYVVRLCYITYTERKNTTIKERQKILLFNGHSHSHPPKRGQVGLEVLVPWDLGLGCKSCLVLQRITHWASLIKIGGKPKIPWIEANPSFKMTPCTAHEAACFLGAPPHLVSFLYRCWDVFFYFFFYVFGWYLRFLEVGESFARHQKLT